MFNKFLKELPLVLREYVFELERLANYLIPIMLKYAKPEQMVSSI